MRRWIITAALVAMVTACHGAMLVKGSRELGIEGLFDSTTGEGDLTDLAIFFGEYPDDNVEVAIMGRIRETDRVEEWRLGARAEVNNTAYEVVPFLAATFEYARVDVESPTDVVTADEAGSESIAPPPPHAAAADEAIVLGVHAGLKWFLAENVAVSAAVVYEWADENIYETEEGEIEDTNLSLRLGMRYLF